MGVGILAPVPAMHVGAMDEFGAGVPVLIYPTPHYGDPDHLIDPGYVNFKAFLDGIVVPKRGVHPDPNVRPITTVEGTEGDTKWAVFWEVAGLLKLSKDDRIAITSLTAMGQSKPLPKGFVPHGPMLVKAAFL